MTIRERIQSPTPPFFKKVRNIGMALAAAGTVVVTAPVTLPTILVKTAGYLVVAGSVASAVSQSVSPETDKKKPYARR